MKLKFNWVPFILSFFAIMCLRIYQILSIGNATVRVQWDNLELICFVIAAVAFAIILILSYLSKDAPDVFVLKKSVFTGLISMITAVFAIWNSVYEIKDYLSSNNDWVNLLSGVLGLFAGITFILIGLNFIQEKNHFDKYRLLALVPTLWILAKLLKLFFEYNSTPTDVSNVSHSLAKIFLLFFLFAQARLFAGLFNCTTFKKLFYFGFSAILFMTVSLTNYIAVAMDTSSELNSSVIVSIMTEIILIVYTLFTLLATKTGKELVNEAAVDENLAPQNSETVTVTENIPEKVTIADDNGVNTDADSHAADMAEVDKLIEAIKNENAQKEQSANE